MAVSSGITRAITRMVVGSGRALSRVAVTSAPTRGITPSVFQQAATSVTQGVRSQQTSQLNGVIRNLNSRRSLVTQNRMTSLQKILEVINKIICGLVLVIAVVNILIHALDLGHDEIKADMYGSVSQTTNIGWFRATLKTFDVLRFAKSCGAALTKNQKVDMAMDAYLRGFTEKDLGGGARGPVPTGLDREKIEEMFNSGELVTKEQIQKSGDPAAPKNQRQFDPGNAAAGGFITITTPRIEYIKELGGQKIEIDTNNPEKTLQEGQIATVTKSPSSFAAFFGIGAQSSSGNCDTCKRDDQCGNIHVNCHHPLDVCLSRAPYNLTGLPGCDKFMCKDYRYVAVCQMDEYPGWVNLLTLQELFAFISQHVSADGSTPIVWPNPGKKFTFLYNDDGQDRRWDLKFDKTWTDGDGTTHNVGDEISSAAWKGGLDGDGGTGRSGFCCDPYTDQDDISAIKATAKTEVTINGITTTPIDKTGKNDDFKTDHSAAMAGNVGLTTNANAAQWSIAIVSPVYKPITQVLFNSNSWGSFESTKDFKDAKKLIDDLHQKNEALKNDVAGLNIDYYTNVPEKIAYRKVGRIEREFKHYTTYRGFHILKQVSGGKNALVQYRETKKDCECAAQALYGSGTTKVDGEFVVGAQYKMTIVRFKREVCDRPTWTKDADNECTFVINCGSNNSKPGDGVIDITYGYHHVGGYVNNP